MILKHYLGISDGLLIERINTDWSMQLFCGILLKPHERIRDTNLPSWWRTYLGRHADISTMQQCLATHWKPFMNDTTIGMQDATCYESRISFPTDVKLVWNCCKEVYLLIQQKRKELKLRKGRMNYGDRKKDFTNFQRTKKKTRRTEKKVRKKLLKFLFRLLQHITELDEKYQLTFSNKQAKDIQLL